MMTTHNPSSLLAGLPALKRNPCSTHVNSLNNKEHDTKTFWSDNYSTFCVFWSIINYSVKKNVCSLSCPRFPHKINGNVSLPDMQQHFIGTAGDLELINFHCRLTIHDTFLINHFTVHSTTCLKQGMMIKGFPFSRCLHTAENRLRSFIWPIQTQQKLISFQHFR